MNMGPKGKHMVMVIGGHLPFFSLLTYRLYQLALLLFFTTLSSLMFNEFVITVSRHDLKDHKIKMESPPIFSVRV